MFRIESHTQCQMMEDVSILIFMLGVDEVKPSFHSLFSPVNFLVAFKLNRNPELYQFVIKSRRLHLLLKIVDVFFFGFFFLPLYLSSPFFVCLFVCLFVFVNIQSAHAAFL